LGRKRVWHLCAQNLDEQIDFDTKMKQLQSEIRDLLQHEEESSKELKSLFEKLGYSL
jgi:type I restriction enzyme M protein